MNFRFAIISDPHIATPQTIRDSNGRFHLVEVSIPVMEQVLAHLQEFDLDFLLIPGDLTQDGEPENHQWLQQRLASLPFPTYVIPGNHDVPTLLPTEKTIGFQDFSLFYQQFGYQNTQQVYYTHEILPGVQLIALNSNQFDAQGKQLGCLDEAQLIWLEKLLPEIKNKLVLVMIHHNVIEHLPGQSQHELGKRYMLANAKDLLKMLQAAGVKLIFTGHLHVQDVAYQDGIYEITTGSLVSYPHPYRIIEMQTNGNKQWHLKIESHRVKKVPGWEDLAAFSKKWMSDRSYPFMMKLLTSSPLNLPVEEAEKYAPQLRYFWADIASGDATFDFVDFPPLARDYFQAFSAINKDGEPNLIDNYARLII
jgi:3',5'-cyclic AMP phosphodiesterase CpdA